MNKNEIIQHLNSAHQLFREEAKNLSPSLLNLSTHGKWSIAQHIDHINKSIAPLCNYLRLPKDKIALKWGLSNRTSLSFKDLQEKFQHAVSSGLAKASGSYLPAERSDFSAED